MKYVVKGVYFPGKVTEKTVYLKGYEMGFYYGRTTLVDADKFDTKEAAEEKKAAFLKYVNENYNYYLNEKLPEFIEVVKIA